MIDIQLLSKMILNNKEIRGWPTHDIEYEMALLKIEANEATEVLHDPEKLPAELADIAIYLISIARIAKIDLEKAIVDKIEYNKTRKYNH